MPPITFESVLGIINLAVPVAVELGKGIVELVAWIRSLGASPEQEAALITVADQKMEAARARVNTSPRLDPANPHQVLNP
jgi:hypothetical protein